MIALRSASITLALFLAGCATSAPNMSVEAPLALDDAEIAEAPEARPETPIPDDSLLPLLQAEFALRQRDFDQGLALLSEQAVYWRTRRWRGAHCDWQSSSTTRTGPP